MNLPRIIALTLTLGLGLPPTPAQGDQGVVNTINEGVRRSVEATKVFIGGEPDRAIGGRLEAMIDGQMIPISALSTDIDGDISGDIATITLTQTFENPTDAPLNVTYAFPMNDQSAVYGLEMEVNGALIEGIIQEKAEARETFEAAKAEGKNAALLTQHRPNVFTQEISNLMPGSPIRVTVFYTQTIPRVDGAYELVIPTVVGPRYTPPRSEGGPVSPGTEGAWSSALPSIRGPQLPESLDPDQVSISLILEPGLPLTDIVSPSHDLWVLDGDPRTLVELNEGRVIGNRDFILRYGLAGDGIQSGILTHEDARGSFFSILLEPPLKIPEERIQPREMVFVLDCSGSMNGHPMRASKAFMTAALRRLRPTDTFRIVRFSEGAGEMNRAPLPATPENIRKGIAYAEGLNSQGGTRMSEGIRQALSIPIPEGSIRLVTFLTDGYIGNEGEVLELLDDEVGEARLFAIGVGSATNRYLLNKMGELGRGFTRYIDPTMDPETAATAIAERLQTPVLTDIHIDWGDLEGAEIYPERPRDLFLGDSVRIQGRNASGGRFPITIHGRLRGEPVSMPLTINIQGSSHDAIPLVWARAAIDQAENNGLRRRDVETDAALKGRITRLGLDYSLMTAYTSFVAVAPEVVGPEDSLARSAEVALPIPAGTQGAGFVPSQMGFSGSSTPEPGTLLGLLMAGSAALAGLRRREGEGGESAGMGSGR